MPWQTVRLKPGVNTEATPTLLETGYAVSQLIRWRDGLAEKIGGWVKFYAFVVNGIIRAMHAWQDLGDNKRLAVGTTTSLSVITNGVLQDLTPQTLTTNFNPDFASTAASATIVVTDPNISTITIFDSVEFKTPVAIGGDILSGVYPIDLVLGATSYQITATKAATTTRANLTISAITQANPGVVTYVGADNIANGDLVYLFGVVGMTQVNGGLYTVAGLNTAANTFQLSGVDTTGFSAYVSGGVIAFGAVPKFSTTSGTSAVTVTLQDHNLSAGSTINFPLSTTVGGLTITDTYAVTSVTDADNFVINTNTEASSTTSAFMNAGQARLVYAITLGPPSSTSGYGIGTYGTGGYGTGASSGIQTGTPISAADWSLDNWGEILLANPEGGGIYWWQPNTGYQNAKLIDQGPIFNNGMFVAMPAQILVAWGSTVEHDIGVEQDPLIVKWSDQENFFEWTPTATTQAGDFHIPTGSKLVGALQTRNYACLWTDIDLWSMEYIAPPLIFAFNKIAANCGLIGKHAVAQLLGNIYWMGQSNFFALTGNGVAPIPCSVRDVVFQDLDEVNASKCVAASNTPFNEVIFFYPSLSGGTGENDRYVKMNTVEGGSWDYGALGRTAWIDQSVLGKPIASSPGSLIFSQETGYDGDGDALTSSFTSGYWVLSEGEEFAFVDFLVPDFKFGTVGGLPDANITVELLATDYPGQTPRVYGPYSVDANTKFINCRLRARQMAIRVTSADPGSFWRLGAVRFRFAVDGRR
jgi:hypothetical protein